MSKISQEEKLAHLLRQHQETVGDAVAFLARATIGDAVLALVHNGRELTRESLLAQLNLFAQSGGAEGAKAATGIALILDVPPDERSAP